jgi:hypothetical protein
MLGMATAIAERCEMPTDPAWYKDALSRKGAVGPCGACGETDWFIEPLRGVLLSLSDQGEVEPNMGNHLIRVSCTRCGLMRLHNTHFLLDEDK